MTTPINPFDAANRLIETAVSSQPLAVSYDGLGNRIVQTVGLTPTYFALDVRGLPEVIYTSEGHAYLHLPGLIMTESATGTIRYLLSDGLGSVRQAVDEDAMMASYKEFDPYGNPVQNGGDPYGYTGEWWEAEVGLLYLRARWYAPETGTFLSRDDWEGTGWRSQSMNGWNYVEGNPINALDPSGQQRIKVWASAFIPLAELEFVHVFFSTTQPSITVEDGFIPTLLTDSKAKWHGDDRGYYQGGSTPKAQARYYHEVIINTDPRAQVEIFNEARTNPTSVRFSDLGVERFDSALANDPPKAQVFRDPFDSCITFVRLLGGVSNPLSPPGITPKIDYDYLLKFDIGRGELAVYGTHDPFPAHELYVDGLAAGEAPNIVQFSPFTAPQYGLTQSPNAGPTFTPIDLGRPWPVPVSQTRLIQKYDKCLCGE